MAASNIPLITTKGCNNPPRCSKGLLLVLVHDLTSSSSEFLEKISPTPHLGAMRCDLAKQSVLRMDRIAGPALLPFGCCTHHHKQEKIRSSDTTIMHCLHRCLGDSGYATLRYAPDHLHCCRLVVSYTPTVSRGRNAGKCRHE